MNLWKLIKSKGTELICTLNIQQTNSRYGDLPCLNGRAGMDAALDFEPGGQPRPLGVASVAGVFCLLGMGVVLGTIILVGEHLFYKYTLPRLRHRPEDSIWRSRNVMFFSQKLYRFINCVELVSPHHAARELVHTVRQGQIASLFQKSVKRVRVLDFLNKSTNLRIESW